MPCDFQILIPLRNPTSVLAQSVASLAVQTDREFAVVLSDNHSTQGLEQIEQAESLLRSAGLKVERVRPPRPLGRVEHWNWAVGETTASWIKPLFVGDWLEPQAVERFRTVIAAQPELKFLHCGYEYHQGDAPPMRNVAHCVPRFRPAAEMGDYVLRFSHQFGPPNAVAFQRDAFMALGGFRPTLPICADSLLCCQLATRFGTYGLAEVLSHFQLHGARFSMSLPGRPAALFQEKLTYQLMLLYQAWTENRPIPWLAAGRLFAREVRSYFQESKRATAPQT